jgi:hypothetical protein
VWANCRGPRVRRGQSIAVGWFAATSCSVSCHERICATFLRRFRLAEQPCHPAPIAIPGSVPESACRRQFWPGSWRVQTKPRERPSLRSRRACTWIACAPDNVSRTSGRYQRRSMLARLVVASAWKVADASSSLCWNSPGRYVRKAVGRSRRTSCSRLTPGRPYIDLMAASTALDLAELDTLLGSQLDAALGIRIWYEAERRRFQPNIERASEWWWLSGPSAGTNRTAVCNAGVLGAAAYLVADVNLLARILVQGLTSVELYLASFDPDGGTSEGPNYLAYSFGAFTLLAHVLKWRSGGQLRLLGDPRRPEIAQYPLRALLSPGQHVTFSDSRPSVRLEPAHLAFLGRGLHAPDLIQLAADQPVDPGTGPFGWAVRSLQLPFEPLTSHRLPKRRRLVAGAPMDDY